MCDLLLLLLGIIIDKIEYTILFDLFNFIDNIYMLTDRKNNVIFTVRKYVYILFKIYNFFVTTLMLYRGRAAISNDQTSTICSRLDIFFSTIRLRIIRKSCCERKNSNHVSGNCDVVYFAGSVKISLSKKPANLYFIHGPSLCCGTLHWLYIGKRSKAAVFVFFFSLVYMWRFISYTIRLQIKMARFFKTFFYMYIYMYKNQQQWLYGP